MQWQDFSVVGIILVRTHIQSNAEPKTCVCKVCVYKLLRNPYATLFNPRCACTARVTVLGLCVSVSVRPYSRTTGNGAAYERYQQL